MQLDSKEQIATGWAGIGNAGNVPQRASTGNAKVVNPSNAAVGDAPAKRGWARGVFNFARNAAIGLLMFTLVPVALVTWRQTHPIKYDRASGLRERLLDIDRLRPLMATKDARITALQAGFAFQALQGAAENTQVLPRAAARKAERPWNNARLTPDMFQSIRAPGFNGPPANASIALASGGFSPAEMSYLRAVAESPVWREFDMVSSAEAVDIIGGFYQEPIHKNISALDMPIARFADTKNLAYAGISRATYYLATGDKVRAEAALRSVIGFGFAMIDNGTNAIDGLIGGVIIGIGRDGMEQFNIATRRDVPANEDASYRPFASAVKTAVNAKPVNAANIRQRLINDAANSALPRTIRYERLYELSMSSCENVGEMVFGPNADIRAAFNNAGKTLARFPSERAYLELLYASTSRMPQAELPTYSLNRVFDGAVTIAATVTHLPRLAACSRVALRNY